MKRAVAYIHGKGGSAAEAERYRPLFPDADVIGFDYRSETPWEAAEEFPAFFETLGRSYGSVCLVAVSIGAWLAMQAGIGPQLDRAYLVSPVVDMEGLIGRMMAAEGVTEKELEEKGAMPTASGEDLSWQYLTYVRTHPVVWDVPTAVLAGGRDSLTPRAAAEVFAREHGAELTVMENGEHWFHTGEQMRFLDAWIRNSEIRRGAG